MHKTVFAPSLSKRQKKRLYDPLSFRELSYLVGLMRTWIGCSEILRQWNKVNSKVILVMLLLQEINLNDFPPTSMISYV